MKKALATQSTPTPPQPSKTPAWIGRLSGGLVLVALVGTLGMVTARSGHSTTGGPVPITDVDNAAKQPFAWTFSPYSSTSTDATAYYTVPAGKELVIEYYSAQLTQYPSGGYGYMYMDVTSGGNSSNLKVIPPASDTIPRNQLTRLYADPGSTVYVEVDQSSGSSAGGNLILSGYFVNVP
jgi:hypothetical protein